MSAGSELAMRRAFIRAHLSENRVAVEPMRHKAQISYSESSFILEAGCQVIITLHNKIFRFALSS